MNINVIPSQSSFKDYNCVVVGIKDINKLCGIAEQLDEQCQGYISSLVLREEFNANLGESLSLFDVAGIQRIILLGLGKSPLTDYSKLNKAAKSAASALENISQQEVLMTWTSIVDDPLTALNQSVIALAESRYRFDAFKSDKKELKSVVIDFVLPEKVSLANAKHKAKQTIAVAKGMGTCKDIMNMPANVCTPRYLAEQAHSRLEGFPNIQVEVLDEEQLHELGMNSYLAVGQGSQNESIMTVIKYTGNGTGKPLVLVGKGLTFDSGGISIKPSAAMDEMKFDVGGAASVLGTIQAIATLNLNVNVIGILAGCENMPDGNAYRPGDILTSMSGKTVEVINTDAEGRLVLCDVLTYVERFEPETVLDIATLAGASAIALGKEFSGVFSRDDKLAKALIVSGEDSGDPAWRLPLTKMNLENLKSPVADICQDAGRLGGGSNAAAFLSEFTKKYLWAHIDIVGTAWHSAGPNKGATGRPVPLLTKWVESLALDNTEV